MVQVGSMAVCMVLEQQLRAIELQARKEREGRKKGETYRERQRQRELSLTWVFETLKPISSNTLPLKCPHLLILLKQCQPLLPKAPHCPSCDLAI